VTAATVVGRGVHTGRQARVALHRADGALRFRTAAGEVPAHVAHVVGTERCTVLGAGAVRVATVEHLLAALRVAGYWSGVVVEVDGEELPILDGSAVAWAEAVESLGPPPPPPEPLRPLARWRWADGATSVEVVPGPERLEVVVDFAHPSVGAQMWVGAPDRYRDVLPARTFAFADDVARLRARGLLRGADERSGILFGNEGPHVPLRFADEPVRHKALDALGDLALIGRAIAGHVRVQRGSHHAHVTAMRHLLATHHAQGPDVR
jgi:UDP-3-O-[3-hydroxymyristoyl] N-acetylglucosamine deacetylase